MRRRSAALRIAAGRRGETLLQDGSRGAYTRARRLLMKDAKKPVCAVVGVGPGNGAAFARRFAKEGYAVALLARSSDFTRGLAAELPGSQAVVCDVTDT